MDKVPEVDTQAKLQKQLTKAFESNNLTKFKDAIDKGAQLNVPIESDYAKRTMYEMALSTPGYYQFVHACINAGCEVNYVS